MKTWIFFLAAFAAVSNATSVNLNQEREASINTPIEGLEKRCVGGSPPPFFRTSPTPASKEKNADLRYDSGAPVHYRH